LSKLKKEAGDHSLSKLGTNTRRTKTAGREQGEKECEEWLKGRGEIPRPGGDFTPKKGTKKHSPPHVGRKRVRHFGRRYRWRKRQAPGGKQKKKGPKGDSFLEGGGQKSDSVQLRRTDCPSGTVPICLTRSPLGEKMGGVLEKNRCQPAN